MKTPNEHFMVQSIVNASKRILGKLGNPKELLSSNTELLSVRYKDIQIEDYKMVVLSKSKRTISYGKDISVTYINQEKYPAPFQLHRIL